MQKQEVNKKQKCQFFILTFFFLFFFSAPVTNKELDPNADSTVIDPSQFYGSLHKEKDENDTNCWTSPSGKGFMIRGRTYLKDNAKVDINTLYTCKGQILIFIFCIFGGRLINISSL